MPCTNHKLVYKIRDITGAFNEKYSNVANKVSIESQVFVPCYGVKCLLSVRNEIENRNVLETALRVTCEKEIETGTGAYRNSKGPNLAPQHGVRSGSQCSEYKGSCESIVLLAFKVSFLKC